MNWSGFFPWNLHSLVLAGCHGYHTKEMKLTMQFHVSQMNTRHYCTFVMSATISVPRLHFDELQQIHSDNFNIWTLVTTKQKTELINLPSSYRRISHAIHLTCAHIYGQWNWCSKRKMSGSSFEVSNYWVRSTWLQHLHSGMFQLGRFRSHRRHVRIFSNVSRPSP